MYFIRRCIVFQKNLSCDNPLQESYLYCLYFQGFPQFWKRRFYSKHINIQKVTTSASKRSALIFSQKSIFVSKVFEFTSSFSFFSLSSMIPPYIAIIFADPILCTFVAHLNIRILS